MCTAGDVTYVIGAAGNLSSLYDYEITFIIYKPWCYVTPSSSRFAILFLLLITLYFLYINISALRVLFTHLEFVLFSYPSATKSVSLLSWPPVEHNLTTQHHSLLPLSLIIYYCAVCSVKISYKEDTVLLLLPWCREEKVITLREKSGLFFDGTILVNMNSEYRQAPPQYSKAGYINYFLLRCIRNMIIS